MRAHAVRDDDWRDGAAMRELLADQLTRLRNEVRSTWERYGLAVPVAIQCVRRDVSGSLTEPEPIFCVARAGDRVLIYDDVEEEFGIGVVDSDGLLRSWGTYGEELNWSLRHFPEASI